MYVKLFESILRSTVWMLPPPHIKVWITFLLLSDREGYVRCSVPGLAKEAGITPDECRAAIAALEAPDPDSQSKEEGGRRIIRLNADEPVWFVVNYSKYRDLRDTAARTEYMREYMRDYRSRNEAVNPCKPDVNSGKQQLAHAEADASASKTKRTAPLAAGAAALFQGSPRRHKYPEWFASWWKLYVHNTGRGTEKWEAYCAAQRLSPEEQAALAGAAAAWFGQREKLCQAGAFVAEAPDPVRFIRRRRWEDELSVPAQGAQKGGPPVAPSPVVTLAAEDTAHGREPGFREYARAVLDGKRKAGTWPDWQKERAS